MSCVLSVSWVDASTPARYPSSMSAPACPVCRHPQTLVSGIGEPARYACTRRTCPVNWERVLKCPNPACGGGIMEEKPEGIGHCSYTCGICGFNFDSLGQLSVPTCKTCRKPLRVHPNPAGGMTLACPNGHVSLDVDALK